MVSPVSFPDAWVSYLERLGRLVLGTDLTTAVAVTMAARSEVVSQESAVSFLAD